MDDRRQMYLNIHRVHVCLGSKQTFLDVVKTSLYMFGLKLDEVESGTLCHLKHSCVLVNGLLVVINNLFQGQDAVVSNLGQGACDLC